MLKLTFIKTDTFATMQHYRVLLNDQAFIEGMLLANDHAISPEHPTLFVDNPNSYLYDLAVGKWLSRHCAKQELTFREQRHLTELAKELLFTNSPEEVLNLLRLLQ